MRSSNAVSKFVTSFDDGSNKPMPKPGNVDMPREEWFVLAAKRPGVSARQLGREYGLEELRAYKDRGRIGIDALRGFSFSRRYGGYPGQAPERRPAAATAP